MNRIIPGFRLFTAKTRQLNITTIETRWLIADFLEVLKNSPWFGKYCYADFFIMETEQVKTRGTGRILSHNGCLNHHHNTSHVTDMLQTLR